MAMEIQPYHSEVGFDRNGLERILLQLADAFDIRIVWDRETVILSSALAVGGAIVGGYAGGRFGAALGAGLAGATGLGASAAVALREIWATVKEKLLILLYILYNNLRQWDPIDYVNGFRLLMACASSKRELVLTILDLIASTLGREVLSNLTAA